MPLITADQTFALSAVIMALVAFGFWSDTQSWGQKLGGPLVMLAISMALANAHIIPHTAAVYDSIAGVLVPLAIPLLVMRADFRTIFSESGPTFVAFLYGTAATIIGALVGVWLVDMGPLEPEIAGTVTASYIGGSVNFVATAEAVGIKDSSIYVAGLSADAVGGVLFLVLLMLLPGIRFVRNAMPSKFFGDGVDTAAHDPVVKDLPQPQPFRLTHIANGLALSLVICAASAALTSLLQADSMFLLVVTTLALLVANFAKPVLRHVSSEFEIGALFMYMFFVCIGAGADLGVVVESALPILRFIGVLVMVHLVLLVTVGAWLKLDLAEVMIASNACILGPATAAAMAASNGWRPLITPGILTGLFGYAIATFIGVALTALLN